MLGVMKEWIHDPPAVVGMGEMWWQPLVKMSYLTGDGEPSTSAFLE